MVKYKICYNFANVQGCIGCGFYYNSLHRKPMPIIKSGSIKNSESSSILLFHICLSISWRERNVSLLITVKVVAKLYFFAADFMSLLASLREINVNI